MSIPQQQQLNLLQAARPPLNEPSQRAFTSCGKVPARDVLKHLPGDAAEAAMLLLGCADDCCLLASLAAAHPGMQTLKAVLDDHNPVRLARGAFLLLLASKLDPNNRDDMQVLWEVWYCALWTPATAARVKPFIHRLQQESTPWLVIPRPGDRDVLLHIWGSWLNKDQPSAAAVLKSRDELATKLKIEDGVKVNRHAVLESALELAVKLDSVGPAVDALSQAVGGVATVEPAKACEGVVSIAGTLQQDLVTFFDSGYLAPNYTGQKSAKPRSVNVTLLRPASSSWRCSPEAVPPSMAWGPFSAAELESAIKSGSPAGVTARLCIARMTEMVRGFQAHTQFSSQPAPAPAAAAAAKAADTGPGQQQTGGRVHVQVQLVCMDPLQLCLSMPLAEVASRASQLQSPYKQKHKQKAGGTQAAARAAVAMATATPATAAAAPLQFDVIDAGTLADDLDTLPLLVAAGARLKPQPHARLFTGVSRWFAVENNFADFVCKKMLHMPLSLTPSILGLRLLTDLTLEGPETTEIRDFRTYWFREVMWAPIPAELQAFPLPQVKVQLLGGPAGSIEAVLQAVATEVCCVTQMQQDKKSTLQLLVWLLASMIQRVDMSALLRGNGGLGTAAACSSRGGGSSGDSSKDVMRASYAATQRVLWTLRTRVAQQLPAHLRLCFITGVDVLRSSLQQNAPPDWQPADVPACAGVLQLTVPWQRQRGAEPAYVRPVLVDFKTHSKQSHVHTAGAVDIKDVEGWAIRGATVPAGVHVTDMWALESSSKVQWKQMVTVQDNLFIYLPVDHGLDPAQVHVYLPGIKQQTQMQHLTPGQVIQAPPTLAQVLLPAACPMTAACIPSSPAAQHSDKPWALRVLSLEESAEWYKAKLQLQPSMPSNATSSARLAEQIVMRQQTLQIYANGHLISSGNSCSDSAITKQRRCSTAHKLVFEFCNPAGQTQVQPAELRLCWPVATSLNETDCVPTNSYSGTFEFEAEMNVYTGVLSVKLLKSQAWEMWPNDEPWHLAPAPLDLAALPPLPDYARGVLPASDVNQYHKDHDMLHGAQKGGPLNFTRHLLARMMLTPPKETHATCTSTASPMTFTATGQDIKKIDNVEMLHIMVHHPVLVTPAGRPILPCTVVDMSMCEGAVAKGAMQRDVLSKLLNQLGVVTTQCSPLQDSCQLLRRLLSRRARACQPTAAQRLVLPDGGMFPYYYSSYVSFMQPHLFVYPRIQLRPEPRGSLSQTMYLQHRLQELMVDMTTKASFDHFQAVSDDIKKLLEHDTGGLLPPLMVQQAQTMINWVSESVPEGGHVSPNHAGASAGAFDVGVSVGGKHAVKGAPATAVTTAAGPRCAQCGKQGDNLSRCGRCKSVQYCSRECQAAHWKEHKGVCKAQLG